MSAIPRKIALDFDDTVADQTSVLLPLMNWRLGTDTKFEDLTWDFFHRDPETEKAFWDLHDAYDTMYLRRAFPPVDPYAFAVIKELQKLGHKVDIVTRNDPKSFESIRAWMWVHGVDIQVRAIGRGTGAGKARLGYSVYVDDNPELAVEIRKHPTKRLIVFDRPWNRDVQTGPNISRANSWLEVREILLRMLA